MSFTRTSGPTGGRTLGDAPSELTKRLIAEGCAPKVAPAAPDPLGGRHGLALGALRDIANDMPGVRAAHKRTAMRQRAEQTLRELCGVSAHREAAE
jgi:hypothetical protein